MIKDKVSVLGDTWKIFVLPDKKFRSKFKNCQAMSIINHKTIYFKESRCDYGTIKHEIAHAFYSYQCIDDASLDYRQYEEFVCEFVNKFGDQIINISKSLFKRLP